MGKWKPFNVGRYRLGQLKGEAVAVWADEGNARRRFRLGVRTEVEGRAALTRFAKRTYDPATGHFAWRRSGKGRRANGIAGSVRHDGYHRIKIGGQQYLAHRLAWLYVHGTIDGLDIDHINGDPTDNSIGNLRPATPQQNGVNSPRMLASGIRQNKCGTWTARIKGKRVGAFSTREEAVAARNVAGRERYGEFWHRSK